MKTRVSVFVLFAVAGLLLTLAPAAQAQTCFFVQAMQTNGTVYGPYTVSSATDDPTFEWHILSGRSYFVEATTHHGPSNSFAINLSTSNINAGVCPTTDVSSGVTLRNTGQNFLGVFSRSVVVTTAPANFLDLRAHNSSASASDIIVSVIETTQFSPRWSTFGGFYTSWGLTNTTNLSCSYALKVINTAGATVATATGTINAGLTVFRDTRATDLNVAASQSGSVILTHDCPPGAIEADGFMVNETTTPVSVIPVKFEAAQKK